MCYQRFSGANLLMTIDKFITIDTKFLNKYIK